MQASCRLLLPVNQGAGVRRTGWLCVSRGSQRAKCRQTTIIRNAVGSSPGGGVLDRPVVLPGQDPDKVRVKVSEKSQLQAQHAQPPSPEPRAHA